MSLDPLVEFMTRGGPGLWVIAGLSVLTLALALWRLIAFAQLGLWKRSQSEQWLADLQWHQAGSALVAATPVERVTRAAICALRDMDHDPVAAERETTRVAKAELSALRAGLRPLELIATIAPLVGLLGTVLGMISAFQALQDSGADPAVLAGGIWEALLTTAAGMAVAIPASALVSWIESIVERQQEAMEDIATRIFNQPRPPAIAAQAAE